MHQGFWATLKKPFFILAPMADVTDTAFRRLIAKYSDHGKPNGGPDVFYTEFVSADGLCSPGREILSKDLVYSDVERPIVGQIFSGHPDKIREAAKLIKELGFDGLDINMGCPDKNVEKQGAGAALIKDPARARDIIRAAREGVGDAIPVSVKTRVGYNKDALDAWLLELLAENPAVVIIHARTRKEMSLVPARWEDVGRAVAIRDKMGSSALVVGNGDVENIADGEIKARQSGADGVMIGRGIFGNPWLFRRDLKKSDVPLREQLEVMMEHTELFEQLVGHKNFAVMKKHYKAYIHGFDGAKELRIQLNEAKDAGEIRRITEAFLATLSQ
jgi:nifR3 family TIM-barrel protein